MRVSDAILVLAQFRNGLVLLTALSALVSASHGAESNPSKGVRLPDFLTPELLKLFEPGKMEVPSSSSNSQIISYQLFKPVAGSEKKEFPLVVWLHGLGKAEIENRNTGQLLHLETLIFREPKQPEKYPFFLLAPQMPEGVRSWDAKLLMGLIEKVVASNSIDPKCISVTGLSVGGYGCWQLALLYPDRIAAASPVASAGCDVGQIEKLKSVPVWAFNSTGDHVVPVEKIRQTIYALDEAGGSCRLTEIDSDAHGCWNEAFRGHDLVAWLIAQKKGTPNGFPPDKNAGLAKVVRSISNGTATIVSNNWPQLMLLGSLTAICIVVWRQWRAKAFFNNP